MKTATRALALSALIFAAPATALGAAGEPDPSFGDGGRRLLAGAGFPVEVLVQPDGKTILVSDGQYTSLRGFVLTRLNVDGSIDRSFDGDGTAAVDFGDSTTPTSAALQADGKIVVTGSTSTGLPIARLDTGGALDKSFDDDGKKLIAGQAGAAEVVIQEDGRIAVATSRTAATQDLTVLRLSENGVPDQALFQPADFGGAADSPVAAASQPEAAIVVVGRTTANGKPVTAVARYTLDGKLDPGLGELGRATIAAVAEPKSVQVTPEGKIVVVGTSAGDDPHIVVARLNADGAPDADFGSGGVAATDFEGQDTPAAAALQPDGKLLVGGAAFFDSAFYTARLSLSGAPDASYGSGGFARFGVADIYTVAMAGALAPDGRFVLAGVSVMSGPYPRTVVARFQADPPPAPAPQPQADPQPVTQPTTATQPQPQPQPRPLPDTQAPTLSGLRLATPFVRFTLSESSRVRFTLGRRTFSAKGVAGANRVRLPRGLKAGRYRLTATATDAAGNAGRQQRITVTVKKGTR